MVFPAMLLILMLWLDAKFSISIHKQIQWRDKRKQIMRLNETFLWLIDYAMNDNMTTHTVFCAIYFSYLVSLFGNRIKFDITCVRVKSLGCNKDDYRIYFRLRTEKVNYASFSTFAIATLQWHWTSVFFSWHYTISDDLFWYLACPSK